jgi:hypothetical protein
MKLVKENKEIHQKTRRKRKYTKNRLQKKRKKESEREYEMVEANHPY